MPNNPVQIILNDRDFHQAPDPGQPPRNKDFFDGADKAFVAHQASLLAAIDRVIDDVRKTPTDRLPTSRSKCATGTCQ